ncbi:hypothetical protein [Chryseobacterium sp. 2987]|uniref:hypothetical protein n=1 Tax=Chryseobacterium sp. 2987 TaxID=2817767 RepID=UPI002866A47E|nr:hypothetical protein [Chryseobacterium sp. 2987]MDR6920567.1 hypothetical protein [Chryseobacterium sp. 2987]
MLLKDLHIKIRFLLLGIAPLLFSAQKERDYLKCDLKSLKTVCKESGKTISEISSEGGIKIYGRLEDLKKELSERSFEKYKEKIRFSCNEKIQFDSINRIYYVQNSGDDRKFNFIYSGQYNPKIRYKGTEDLKKFKDINLNSPQKYLQLYSRENENNRDYEVYYYFYNQQDRLEYSFHQHGNEFIEYTFIYQDSLYGPELTEVYKNGILSEEYSYYKNEDTSEKIITEYPVDESYRLDKKNRPFLKKSAYVPASGPCNCPEGYITKIIYWDEDRCSNKIILE